MGRSHFFQGVEVIDVLSGPTITQKKQLYLHISCLIRNNAFLKWHATEFSKLSSEMTSLFSMTFSSLGLLAQNVLFDDHQGQMAFERLTYLCFWNHDPYKHPVAKQRYSPKAMQFESYLRPACSWFCQRDAVQSAMASQDVVNCRNEDESQDQILLWNVLEVWTTTTCQA